MFALLAFPFKLVGLILHVFVSLLRTATGLVTLLLNPVILIVVLLFVAAAYFL